MKNLRFCKKCCSSADETESPRQRERPRRSRRTTGRSNVLFELLLLGADGSGKSTFIRQMQLIHGQGFNDIDRQEIAEFVHKNIFDAMDVIILQMEPTRLNINFNDEERKLDVKVFQDEDNSLENRLSAIRRLWDDPEVKSCFNRRGEYSDTHPLNVSTEYFMDKLGDINRPGYLPTTEDVIRVRKNTVGVIQYDFTVSDINFKITDVGGEREERTQWIDFLAQKITCVIFLAAIDEYDTYLITEDNQRLNRLKESIEIFSQIQLQIWLNNKTFILFLNKKDIFEDKIKKSHLIDHFEDFKGFKRESASAHEFIKRKFLETQPPSRHRSRMIYTHQTCATDTENMKIVFEVVRDTILQINLRHYNLE